MKTILIALALACIAHAQQPYSHPEGTRAYQAAQTYRNTVIYAYNKWQMLKISKGQFIRARQIAWQRYITIAFPPEPVKPYTPNYSDNSSQMADFREQFQRQQMQIEKLNQENQYQKYLRDVQEQQRQFDQDR